SRYHGVPPGEITWTDTQKQKRAVGEYLDALDAEAKRQGQAESDHDSGPAGGGAEGGEPDVRAEPQPPERKAPKGISPSDPAAAWAAKANKRVSSATASTI